MHPVILRVLSRTAEFIITDVLYFGLPLLPKFVIPAFVNPYPANVENMVSS